jgi:hypothetical protein
LAIYDALAASQNADQRSSVAAASHAIISHYFPEQQPWLDSLLMEHQKVQLTDKNIYNSTASTGYSHRQGHRQEVYRICGDR